MTGSLQIKNGKYYAVLNVTDVNGNRKQKWISTGMETKGNKKRAEQFLRDKIKEFELKGNVLQTDMLFSDYVLQWLNLAKLRLDESTYQSYKFLANAHIVPYFSNSKVTLDKLTRNDLQMYVNHKYEKGRRDGKGGLSAKSVKSHMVLIKQALKEAVKSNLIVSNPSDYIVLPKIQKFESSFYTVNQLKELFVLIKSEPLYPLIYITAVFGLRRSEVLGLKWDSINFENNTLTIKHTVVGEGKIIAKDSTKNASSYRSYPISEDVKSMLLYLMSNKEKNKMLFGNEYNENDYVFCWDNGNPYKPDYISRHFKQILIKYNLPVIRFHDLRHSCASLLVSNGFTLKDIQEWLGHADIQTTANIYAHLDTERKANIMKSMTDVFSSSSC